MVKDGLEGGASASMRGVFCKIVAVVVGLGVFDSGITGEDVDGCGFGGV